MDKLKALKKEYKIFNGEKPMTLNIFDIEMEKIYKEGVDNGTSKK